MLNAAVHLLAKEHWESISISTSEVPLSIYLADTESTEFFPFKVPYLYERERKQNKDQFDTY